MSSATPSSKPAKTKLPVPMAKVPSANTSSRWFKTLPFLDGRRTPAKGTTHQSLESGTGNGELGFGGRRFFLASQSVAPR